MTTYKKDQEYTLKVVNTDNEVKEIKYTPDKDMSKPEMIMALKSKYKNFFKLIENKKIEAKELDSFWKKELGNNVHNLPEYEFRALRLAEINGIVNYEVNDNIMTFIEKLPTEGTFKHTVDLSTMEETSEQIGPRIFRKYK